jgi:hypothetical protein
VPPPPATAQTGSETSKPVPETLTGPSGQAGDHASHDAIDAEEVAPEHEIEDPRPPAVTVERAKLIKTGGTEPNVWRLYGFKFSDGVEATCFDTTFFEIAAEAGASGALVRYETSPGKKAGTLNLTNIEIA